MKKTRTARLAGALLTLLLLLTACASGSDESQAEPSVGEDQSVAEGGGTAQGVTDDTIKIGLFAPFSGSAAVFGKGSHTIESIYRRANEDGGINGRQIELVIEDSQCDPAALKLAVRKLIEREEVFMLHGGMCSNATLNVVPDIQESGIPFVVMASANEGIVDPPTENIFHGWANQGGGTAMNAEMVVSHAQETGGNKVALVAMPDEWGQGWAEGFKRDLENVASREGVDVEIVTEVEIPTETGDATASVRGVGDSDADIVVIYAYPQPMSVFLRDAFAADLDIPKLTGQGTFVDDQLERVGDRAAVTNFFSSYCLGAPLTSAEMKPYGEALAEYYPEDVFDSSAMLGVSGAELNLAILEAMGDDMTWENWIAQAEQLEALETPTAPTPVQFAPFDSEDASTRVAAGTCKAAHVALEEGGDLVVLDPSWADWTAVRDG